MVSIAAFQAVDPGSIPGRRSFFEPNLFCGWFGHSLNVVQDNRLLWRLPSIAQLVERWTVVVQHQTSIGRWFKSGSKEDLSFYHLFFIFVIRRCHLRWNMQIFFHYNLAVIAQLGER